ncbi:MAG TPA: hypothetical protein VMI31_16030 [Fimbriimonadaceae bacterium]|nr:hypothetical protein [Fimbriimonadaceae bacterium]
MTVSVPRRVIFLSAIVLSFGPLALAQQFEIGATYGWVNDVTHDWNLGSFQAPNWEGWAGARIEEGAVTRLTFGSLRIPGSNAGAVIPQGGGSSVVMPSYTDQIGFATLDVSYLFLQGPMTCGVFAGIGGYKTSPQDVPPGFTAYEDPRQTVFGWNAGVEGYLHLYRGLAGVGRLTFHDVFTQTRRYLLVASVGAAYRF